MRVGLDTDAGRGPAARGDRARHRLDGILGIGEADALVQPASLEERRLIEPAEHHHRLSIRRQEAAVIARARGVPPREIGEMLGLVHDQEIDAPGGHLAAHGSQAILVLRSREDEPRVVAHAGTSADWCAP